MNEEKKRKLFSYVNAKWRQYDPGTAPVNSKVITRDKILNEFEKDPKGYYRLPEGTYLSMRQILNPGATVAQHSDLVIVRNKEFPGSVKLANGQYIAVFTGLTPNPFYGKLYFTRNGFSGNKEINHNSEESLKYLVDHINSGSKYDTDFHNTRCIPLTQDLSKSNRDLEALNRLYDKHRVTKNRTQLSTSTKKTTVLCTWPFPAIIWQLHMDATLPGPYAIRVVASAYLLLLLSHVSRV